MAKTNFSAIDVSYLSKTLEDFPFLKRSEGILLVEMSKAKSRRDEFLKGIIPRVPVNSVRPITVLFHSVTNGFENDLYEALVAYLDTGEVKEYPDSLLLQHLLDRAVKIVEKENQHNS